MTGWAGQAERGSGVLLRAALWACLRAGWPLGRALLWPITAWFLVTSGPARAASRDYLGRVLGRPAHIREVALHFHTFASAVLDRVFLLSGRMGGFRIRTDGLEHVTAVLACGKGCILLGAHLGSFEVLRSVAQDSPVPVWALMYRRNVGPLTRLLDRLAPDMRDSIIEIGDAASMIRAHECVERGEIVGILADRSPPGHRVVDAPFLGSPAAFPAGPFILASTLGVPVVLFHGVRLGPRRYAVRFEPFADAITLRRRGARHAWPTPTTGSTSFRSGGAMRFPRRAALLCLLSGAPARAAELDVAALMARLAAVPGRSAAFTETRRFAALDQPLESSGRLTYRRPGYVEKETTFPERERLVMDGDRLVLTTGAEPPRVVDIAAQPELQTLVDAIRGPLAGDLTALRRAFHVRGEGTPDAWRLDLTPLDLRAGRLVRRVAIAGSGADVQEVLVMQANGDEQRMTIAATP